ncbi:MAG: hypothetical protein WB780_03515 [Candidatus Acidiferrales bacterium]
MNPLLGLLGMGCALFLAALCLMAVWPLPEETAAEPGDKIEDLLPLHTQHFPQLKHALDSTDKRYISRKVSSELQRSWRDERGKILKSFVEGLARDFGRVVRLGRVVDLISPGAPKADGTERFWLALRFRLHFRILSRWVSGDGRIVIWQVQRLTAVVGSLSAMAEAGMLRRETIEEDEVPSSFNG